MRIPNLAPSGTVYDAKTAGPATVSALPGRSDLDSELVSRVTHSADREAFNHRITSYNVCYTKLLRKGGNKAQYVGILSDKVDRVLSLDGQGFSKEFVEKYQDLIDKNRHKIRNNFV